MTNTSVLDNISAEDMAVLKEIIGPLTEDGSKVIFDAIREDPKNLQIIIDSYKKKTAVENGDEETLKKIAEEEGRMEANS